MPREGAVAVWVIALAGLAVLVALRLAVVLLGVLDLQFDEAQYWGWSQALDWGYLSKPPGIAWVIAASTALLGDGEGGVRAASPLLHGLSALFLWLGGRALLPKRAALLAALLYATMPAVAYSSLFISTDVPLLACWTAALAAWAWQLRRPTWAGALALGLAIGLGLQAKYAMGFFLIGVGVHAAISADARRALLRPAMGAGALLALALIAPNVVWNLRHGFATLTHTAANAEWGESARASGIVGAAEFLLIQAALLGPVTAVSAILAARSARGGDAGRGLLLAFSVPVLAIMTAQALVSRANANWAATALPALVLLAAGFLARSDGGRVWAGVAVASGLALTMWLSLAYDGVTALPRKPLEAFPRLLGWRDLAETVGRALDEDPRRTILCDERKIAVELAYYLRERPPRLVMWSDGGPPRSQFEATAPLDAGNGAHVLFVTRFDRQYPILARYRTVAPLGKRTIDQGAGRTMEVNLYAMDGYLAP